MELKKLKTRKVVAMICICSIVTFLIPNVSYATAQDDINASKIIPVECKTILSSGKNAEGVQVEGIKGFEPELKEFLEFLDANFKNKSSTSSLTDLAIARYSEYRTALRDQFKKLMIAGAKKATEEANDASDGWAFERVGTFDEQVRNYAACEEMVNTYISLGRQEMLKHIKKSAAQKKTIMLLEKFKALNSKLRGLNMKIAEMYGLFATFKNKFPGFAKKSCMKKLS